MRRLPRTIMMHRSQNPVTSFPSPLAMRISTQGLTFFRRRPLFTAVLSAFFSWLAAGWWWGPVRTYGLALGPNEACNVLGLAEDGSLIGAERTPHTASWTVWKRTFPDDGREDVWKTSGTRTLPPDDITFRLQPGGRWLFVSKLSPATQPDDDPIVDLRTGKVYPGHDNGMRWVTPNGRLVLTADVEAGVRINDLATGSPFGRIDDEWINALSVDGRWVAAESSGVLRVWRLDETGVAPTRIILNTAAAPSSRLGAANDADYQSTCQFTDDCRQFVVFGERRVEIWNLEEESQAAQLEDFSPIGISGDGRRGYERNGHVFDTTSGDTLVDAAGWRNDIAGVRVEPDGWFLSQRNPQTSWWGRGWPGAQFRFGPYTIAISADNSLQNVGCDLIHADAGRRVMLPLWFLPASVTPGGSREEWSLYTHPQRLALHNAESGLVRVIDMPPADTFMPRLLTALALFAVPGWWCWRGRFAATGRS